MRRKYRTYASAQTGEDIEHQLQKAEIDWCTWQSLQWPELASIYAVPNQGKRSIQGYERMIAEGLKKGQWDLCLPVPRRGFGALYVENKAPIIPGRLRKSPTKKQKEEGDLWTKPKIARLSPKQIERGKILEAMGNLCYVIRHFEHFVILVTWYLGCEDPVHPTVFSRGELWEFIEGGELEY